MQVLKAICEFRLIYDDLCCAILFQFIVKMEEYIQYFYVFVSHFKDVEP